MKLLGLSNAKTTKGEKRGWYTGILYLIPAEASGLGVNLCLGSTRECRKFCLVSSGLGGVYPSIGLARQAKTEWYVRDPEGFVAQLACDVDALAAKGVRDDFGVSVRLNGTSDVEWIDIPCRGKANIFACFPSIRFYDYTKRTAILRNLPANYDITFSRSERNEKTVLRLLAEGQRTAVVFGIARGKPLPDTWHGYPVVDGDLDDLRFLDPAGVVVGLRAKGSARTAPSSARSFVVSA